MNNQSKKSNTVDKSNTVSKVLAKIKSGQVKMRPKIYFVLKTLSVVLGILIVGLFVLYLISFISFILRVRGVWYLPGFGFPGVRAALKLAPWLLILSAGALIIILELVVKRFSFAYRRPVVYSLIAIIILALLGGLLVEKTKMHLNIFQRAQQGRLPVMGRIYRGFAEPQLGNVQKGMVSKLTDNGFLLATTEEELRVIITQKTRLQPGSNIKENDKVVVLGRVEQGVVKAVGVRQVNEDLNMFPLPYRPPRRLPR